MRDPLRSFPRPLALLLAASLTAATLTACGGGDDSGTAAAPQADPSTPFTPAASEEEVVEPDTWPLTGLPVADGDSSVAEAPDPGHQDGQHHLQLPAGRA